MPFFAIMFQSAVLTIMSVGKDQGGSTLREGTSVFHGVCPAKINLPNGFLMRGSAGNLYKNVTRPIYHSTKSWNS